ncbi:MAG TPA: hypothetical protein VFB38_20855 [Chthonomonadaceae bacterium]|nr:hypothetical protein [Chthonomonadaceae bacterium]
MLPHEDEQGEGLWNHIEDIKQAGGPARPAPLDTLLPVADALHDALSSDGYLPNGQAQARARLVEAIRADRGPVAPPAPTRVGQGAGAAGTLFQQHWPLIRLLIILAVGAITVYMVWTAYLRSCDHTPTQPRRSLSRENVSALQPVIALQDPTPSLQPSYFDPTGTTSSPQIRARGHCLKSVSPQD